MSTGIGMTTEEYDSYMQSMMQAVPQTTPPPSSTDYGNNGMVTIPAPLPPPPEPIYSGSTVTLTADVANTAPVIPAAMPNTQAPLSPVQNETAAQAYLRGRADQARLSRGLANNLLGQCVQEVTAWESAYIQATGGRTA